MTGRLVLVGALVLAALCDVGVLVCGVMVVRHIRKGRRS